MKKSIPINVFSMTIIIAVIGLSVTGCKDDGDSKKEKPSPSFTISPDKIIFTEVGPDYSAPSSKSVKVTNTGNTALSVDIALSGTNAESFTLNKTALSLAVKASENFTVVPKTGLGAGTYTATGTVSAKDAESKNFTVSFPVNEPQTHVYIAFGQSNMQGPGEVRAQDKDRTTISDRWKILNVVAGTYAQENRAKGKWYKAVPPLIIPDSGSPNYLGIPIGLGPTDYFGRTLTEGTPEHITIGVVAVAHGDLALGAYHKTRAATYFDSTGGNGSNGKEDTRPKSTERQGWTRYTGAGYTSIYNAIIDNVKIAQEEGGIVKGIIVHQGESGRGLTYATWENILKEIYDDMLEDLGLEPNSIPILLGQLWNAGTGPGGYLNTNNTLIKAVIPNAWVISTAGLNEGRTGQGQPDNIHFGAADLEGLGTRYGEKMLELVY
jgi:hypothetical protein